MTNLEWVRNEHGEYNEHVAKRDEHSVTIYSERNGGRWYCFLDDEGYTVLDSYDLNGAKKEAEVEFQLSFGK